MTDTNQQWLERQLRHGLTEPQARCLDALCTIDRAWNMDKNLVGEKVADRWTLTDTGGISVRYRRNLAIYPGSSFSKAGEHDRVRLDIYPMSSTTTLVTAKPWELDPLDSRNPILRGVAFGTPPCYAGPRKQTWRKRWSSLVKKR